MCGIAGIVALKPGDRPNAEAVRAMAVGLSHRGPDGEGLWVSPSGRACFAHRRLSIIDLATGAQPFVSADGAFGLVFNGEIYNYLELRDELEQELRLKHAVEEEHGQEDGHELKQARASAGFRTTSDTEVLAAALRRDGLDSVARLKGMFAFAAWDDDARQLLLARDRLGKKPLFYYSDGRFFYFCSSLSALRRALPSRPEIDPDAVEAYLSLGYVPAPLTIYKGVRKLRAAESLSVAGGAMRPFAYWSLADEPEPFEGDFDAAVDRLQTLLEEAVTLRLRSDVPLGVHLSGGVDSSLVATVAARLSTVPLESFSIAFAEAGFDESSHAAAVAQRLGTRHRRFEAKADLLDLLPQLALHFGEPFADSSALPMWLLARHTRETVTVALGGDGGDEGFAGYRWYDTGQKLQQAARFVPPAAAVIGADLLQAPALRRSRALGRAGRALAMLSAGSDAERFQRQRALFSPEEMAVIRGPRLDGARRQTSVAAGYAAASGSPLRLMRHADIVTYLADGLMPKTDVTSMAHGLEVRSPLLDQEVIRFGLSLPDEFLRDAQGGKRLLRALLGRYLPGLSFVRPKQGFSAPMGAWLGSDYEQRLGALAVSRTLADTGLIDAGGVAALTDEHRAGRRDHGDRLFALLMLEEWLQAENDRGEP